MEALTQPFDVHVARRSFGGLPACGDLPVAQPFANGFLLGAIDGLGHGEDAQHAARTAGETLSEHAGKPLAWLLRICHDRLRPTRGAVMSLASFHGKQGTAQWLGVGNVQGVLLRPRPSGPPARVDLVSRAGVVGCRLPELQTTELRLEPGDLLVLVTDGIDASFERVIDTRESPAAIARRILDHARPSDDALVLVARYEPEPS
jgi:serine/threonine protein phosphatase PrpC